MGFPQFLRVVTPVRLAGVMGFLEGVICLLNCGGQPREDLLKWWKTVTVFQDAATAALLTYHNRGVHTASPESPKSLFSAKSFGVTRKQLSLFCPDPNKDMPGGMKWLEHAIRRGNAAGSYVLLERGADRNAVLDDGTPLIKLALENNQDMIAMLLLFNWLVMGLEDGWRNGFTAIGGRRRGDEDGRRCSVAIQAPRFHLRCALLDGLEASLRRRICD
jgi:hypothetical protein